ncbi:MAG: aminoacetone oxidase family FAD-binding enzyme, partial [Lachnospiraceae bacterium]|nr:aminoacetone oxidase family FAD-binding enzyme [Lachnospiraceae bacterium]
MNVCVIGGGAAGMMAAVTAAKAGSKVTLYEKNEKLGKKVYITGKGRCNLTNDADIDAFFQNICSNPKFMYSAFDAFDNRDVMDLMTSNGLKLKVERGKRVFPESDHASDVINVFANLFKKLKITLNLNTPVSDIKIDEENRVTGVIVKGKFIPYDSVIICTGGLSYPLTGSTGDGFKMAANFGHKVTECVPALVPLRCSESWVKSLMGLSLKNVTVTLQAKGKTLYTELGEMLFTHFGVSGPAILSASSYYTLYQKRRKDKDEEPAEIVIDL